MHTRTHSNSYAQIHTTEQIMCCIFLGALNLSRGLNCIYHNKATRLVLCASFPYLPTSLPLSLALSLLLCCCFALCVCLGCGSDLKANPQISLQEANKPNKTSKKARQTERNEINFQRQVRVLRFQNKFN